MQTEFHINIFDITILVGCKDTDFIWFNAHFRKKIIQKIPKITSKMDSGVITKNIYLVLGLKLTEEVQPDYVVLTLPIGKTHQENPSRKPIKKELMRMLILDFCKEPKSFLEIMNMLKLKDRVNLKRVYISPLIAEGLLTMTEPDNPTSRNQMYVATKAEKP